MTTENVTAASERQALARAPSAMLIDGRWVAARSGDELSVEDPATQIAVATVPDAAAEDGVAAVDAASRAQAAWAATPPRKRGEVLRRAFELMTERLDELALLITIENGKTLAESKGEVAYAAEFFRWFSEEAVRVDGRYTAAPDGRSRLLGLR